MSDILLAKPILPYGLTDCSVGEPYVIRKIFMDVFNISMWDLPQAKNMWDYPEQNGYKPLIQLLELKYKAPIVITNGAKQGLAANGIEG